MIVDIPVEEDFRSAGKDFLCLAWETILGLSLSLEDTLDHTLEDDEVITDTYWEAAQRPLSTALSLTEQAVEFLLKGKIASVSPFLLIANDYPGWPKQSSSNQVRFSDFKTIDAKDLLRVYNTIAHSPLNDEFRQRYEQLRSKRNTIMHTVDPTLRVKADDVMVDILEIHKSLLGDESWIDIRRNHIYNSPDSVVYLYASEQFETTLIREIEHAIITLPPALASRYFGINKKQRRYLCPDCYCTCVDYCPNGMPLTTLLTPNTPASTSVHCIICEKDFEIERRPCSNPDCKGHILHKNDGTCLTCFADN